MTSDRAEFDIIYNLGVIATRLDRVTPARLTLGPIDANGEADARIENAIDGRGLTLGKTMRIAPGGPRRILTVAPRTANSYVPGLSK